MPKPLPRLLAIGVAAATGLVLSPAPASAAPAFEYVSAGYSTSTGASSGGCSSTTPNLTSPPSKDLVENGAAVAGSVGGSQSWRNDANAADTATMSVSTSGSTRATSTGTTPRSVEVSFSGQASMTRSKSTSFPCAMRASAGLYASFEFTTTTPLIATVTQQRAGAAATSVYLDRDGGQSEYYDAEGSTGGGTTTTYLPPGRYYGSIGGGASLSRARTAQQAAGSGSVKITFTVPGEAIKGPKGKARKVVALPAGRTCAAHVVAPQLTTKAKKLKKVSKVSFTVNGKKAKTLKGKKLKKGKVVAIRIADKATAKVVVTVTMKNGKKVTAKATYRPCA